MKKPDIGTSGRRGDVLVCRRGVVLRATDENIADFIVAEAFEALSSPGSPSIVSGQELETLWGLATAAFEQIQPSSGDDLQAAGSGEIEDVNRELIVAAYLRPLDTTQFELSILVPDRKWGQLDVTVGKGYYADRLKAH